MSKTLDYNELLSEVGALRARLAETEKCLEDARASEAMFRDLSENALVGVYLIQNDRMVYLNEKYSRISGYSKEEILNFDNIFEKVHPEDRETVRENLRKRLSGETKTMDYEFRIIKKDGSVAFIEVLGSATVYKGSPAVIGTVIDVTERKTLEREREDFYAMLTHDLKSPLTAVMSYVYMLSDKAKGLDPDTKEMIDAVRSCGNRLQALIMDFLTVSRLSAGKLSIKPLPTDIPDALREVYEDFDGVFLEKGLVFHNEISEGLPKAAIDKRLVQRAVSNLLENAANYSLPGGKIMLKTELINGEKGGFIVISVEDTGKGIEPEEQGRVFDKYYRSPRTAGTKGTGLGLSIVKGVAEAHGGRVELISAPEKGSVFKLHLPV